MLTKMQGWQQRIDLIEKSIKTGKHKEVIKSLSELNRKKIPREFAATLAHFAFRVSTPLLALKILHPYIHNEYLKQAPPNAQEKMAYATGLLALGAVREANQILQSIDSQVEPEVLFHQGISGIYEWNYEVTVSKLRAFVKASNVSEYRKLVGKVNLLAAYIYLLRWNEAEPLLEEIIGVCNQEQHVLLLGNCYELKAQFYFFQKKYEQALEQANKSFEILKEQNGLYYLFAKKWQILASYFLSPNLQDLNELTLLKEKAREVRHWNTLRECDLFLAIARKDAQLAQKVMVGTPAESYRQRVRFLFSGNLKVANKYFWYLSLGELPGVNCEITFDPYVKLFKRAQLLSVYDALTRDFYKPSSIGDLFEILYPDEKFNYNTSPIRVLKALRRLNAWFKNNEPRLEIKFQKSEFSIQAIQSIKLVVIRGQSLTTPNVHFEKLQKQFLYRRFSVGQTARFLSVSKATAQRLLKSAIQNGILSKEGAGRSTVYYFANLRIKAQKVS
jgi:tetratricopeptide (TPR) repeat protein